jgi:WD40 repeat protein
VSPAAAPTTPPSPTGYEILGELGRGGMGVVYKASQVQLKRVVALKMILSGAHADGEERLRFRTEAEAIARLQHPNIVQVFEVGEWQASEVSSPVPYFSLEFCPGGSLERKLGGTPLAPLEAAKLAETLARALHSAHTRGIIHRDLKPANVLLTPAETQPLASALSTPTAPEPDGSTTPLLERWVPKVTDFGLAKRLDEVGQTPSGAVMGTPSYMAPEQAGGNSQQVGPLADVYALGAILYECLTGRPPFRAATTFETLQQVLCEDPVPPRAFQSRVPRDLDTICLKCLRKEPQERYESAAQLADDLARFLRGEPIRARRVGRWGRLWRWAKRRPAAAALLFTGMVATLLAGGVALALTINAQLQAAYQKLQKAQHRGAIWQAQHAWLEGDANQARFALESCPLEQRFYEWTYLDRLFHSDGRTLTGHTDEASGVAFSPDESRLVSVSKDKTVRVWDTASGQQLCVLTAHQAPVNLACFRPGGALFATGDEVGKIIIWDAATYQAKHTLAAHAEGVTCLVFAPNGQLVSGSYDSWVRLWDADTGKLVRAAPKHEHPVVQVACSPDGRSIWSCDMQGGVQCWDLGAQEPQLSSQAKLPMPIAMVAAAFRLDTQALPALGASTVGLLGSPLTEGPFLAASALFPGRADVQQLFSASDTGEIELWDSKTGQHLQSWERGGLPIFAFSSDGQTLALQGSNGVIRLHQVNTQRALRSFRGHEGAVAAVALSPSGRRLASGGFDHTVKIWDPTTDQDCRTLRAATVVRLAFSPDGTLAYPSVNKHAVATWHPEKGEHELPIRLPDPSYMSAVFGPRGEWIAVSCADGQIRLWETATGRYLHAFTGPSEYSQSLACSPDGRFLASIHPPEKEVRPVNVWDVAQRRKKHSLNVDSKGAVGDLAFSPDGRLLAAVGGGRSVKLWEVETGRELPMLEGHSDDLMTVAFSPDGRWLASAGVDTTIKLWDVSTWREVQTLRGHALGVNYIAFSPDSRRLASVGMDHVLRVWDLDAGQTVLTLKGHLAPTYAIAFSPDGKYLVSASQDGVVKIW